MKKYKVMLEGKNFLMKIEGKVRRLGFFTTRFLEANNPEDAKLKAVQMIRDDKQFSEAVQNEREDPPMIYLDSIYELKSFDGLLVPGTDYAFFPDESKNQ
jgi:hypothetical protein